MLTVGIAGYDGGKMAELDASTTCSSRRPSSVHRIQEAQTTVYHLLWELTVASLAGAGGTAGTGGRGGGAAGAAGGAG